MADTLREKIIKHIVATLGDYGTFVAIPSPVVSRGQQLFDPDVDPLPVIAVLPGVEEAERTRYGTTHCTMPVDISCLISLGDNNPSELGEAVLGELITAALSSLPSDAEDMAYSSGGIESYPDQMGQAVLSVGITINVQYETDTGDPYNLT